MTHGITPGSPFEDRPVEPDTKVFFAREVRVGHLDALHEGWSWDGVFAESLVFRQEDVKGRDDEAFAALLRDSNLLREESEITVRRGIGGFTFLNFNFWCS